MPPGNPARFNIATSLGIGGSPQAIAATWRRAVPRRFDVGRIEGPWGRRLFFESAGVGLIAATMADAGEAQVDDELRHGQHRTRHMLDDARPQPLAVTLDGEPLAREPILVEAMNIGRIGSRLHLAGPADPGDGLLDIICLEKADAPTFAHWLELADKERTSAPLPVHRGRRLTMAWQGMPLHLDDHIEDPPGTPPPSRSSWMSGR